ncbi:Hypothetical predicted protein [Cloeon dipterum]|uniref:Uncharacterized protein n=1 Tax=Cloeon dipterum TaxID=197152 RepID=A0A8S1CJM8_9INSE|nr:Hypothetical predicted protein [Cloeon dipterum]
MRSKTARSSRVLPPKNSQSPLVILGNKKKQQTATGKTNAAAVLKTKAQPKLGRSRAPSGEKPLPKGKLKKADAAAKAEVPDKKMEPPTGAAAKSKAKKLASPPPAKKKAAAAAAPKKEKAAPAVKKPLRKVKAPKATPAAPRTPPKKQQKEEKPAKPKGGDEPLLTKDGKVRKRAPYKKRVKVEPASIELTDSAIAKILSKAKEPRGTKDKKVAQAKDEAPKKPKAKPPDAKKTAAYLNTGRSHPS